MLSADLLFLIKVMVSQCLNPMDGPMARLMGSVLEQVQLSWDLVGAHLLSAYFQISKITFCYCRTHTLGQGEKSFFDQLKLIFSLWRVSAMVLKVIFPYSEVLPHFVYLFFILHIFCLQWESDIWIYFLWYLMSSLLISHNLWLSEDGQW